MPATPKLDLIKGTTATVKYNAYGVKQGMTRAVRAVWVDLNQDDLTDPQNPILVDPIDDAITQARVEAGFAHPTDNTAILTQAKVRIHSIHKALVTLYYANPFLIDGDIPPTFSYSTSQWSTSWIHTTGFFDSSQLYPAGLPGAFPNAGTIAAPIPSPIASSPGIEDLDEVKRVYDSLVHWRWTIPTVVLKVKTYDTVNPAVSNTVLDLMGAVNDNTFFVDGVEVKPGGARFDGFTVDHRNGLYYITYQFTLSIYDFMEEFKEIVEVSGTGNPAGPSTYWINIYRSSFYPLFTFNPLWFPGLVDPPPPPPPPA